MTKPWALLLSPTRPDAQGNGLARRAWHWAATLSTECHLMTIVIGPYPEAAIGRVPVPGELHVLPTNNFASAPGYLPDWIHSDLIMAERLSAILPHEPPRRVVVFRLYLDRVAALLPAAWRGRAEIDFDDRESATRRSLAWLGLRRGRWRLALSNFRGALAYARLERAALARYACVHMAAPEDVDALRRDAGSARLIATCNRIADIRPPLAARPSPTVPLVLFVGTLSYLPNEDAVLWLAEAIAPRLRRLVPGIRVAVVGAAPLVLAARLRRTGIEYLGPLPDLTEVYAAASLAIVPLRGGGGTKIKVLEAWQYHCPVVATRHACRGLGVVPGEHLLQADSAGGIARACQKIISDPTLAAHLRVRSQELLQSRFLLARAADRVSEH